MAYLPNTAKLQPYGFKATGLNTSGQRIYQKDQFVIAVDSAESRSPVVTLLEQPEPEERLFGHPAPTAVGRRYSGILPSEAFFDQLLAAVGWLTPILSQDSVESLLTLSVCPKNKVYVGQDMLIALDLRHKQPIELVPPRSRNGGLWHLDIRPFTPLASLTCSLHSNTAQFEMRHALSPRHFKNPTGPGMLFKRLTLELTTLRPDIGGYYPLRPNHTLSAV
jgi:hypothetical protein